jgi:hypothetical protein
MSLEKQRLLDVPSTMWVIDGGTADGINENSTQISRQGFLSTHMISYCNSIIKGLSSLAVTQAGMELRCNVTVTWSPAFSKTFFVSEILSSQIGRVLILSLLYPVLTT